MVLTRRNHVKFQRGTARGGEASPAVRRAECIYLRSKKTVVTPLHRHVRHEGAACVTSERSAPPFLFPSRSPAPRPVLPSLFHLAGNTAVIRGGSRIRGDGSTPNSPRSIVTRFHGHRRVVFFLSSSLVSPLPAAAVVETPVGLLTAR